MSVPVTRTKIIAPRRRPDLLARPRLLQLDRLLDYRLFIVAAPAGYGKTSLLVDFAARHQAELAVCWYALDSLDRNPQRFLAHFIASITMRFPTFGRVSQAVFEASSLAELDLDRLVTTLVNEIYEHIHEHFLIVLDDFHLVSESKEIEGFLNRFVQEVGENCHLVLSSRTLLALSDLPLLVARSQVDGLSFEELAFQSSEIQALIRQNYPGVAIPDEAAAELARETEGWITGLLLSAQTMWQGMTDRLRVARVSGVGLYDYLAQQVLDGQPPAVRDFLLRTSLLEEFDAGLCQDVFGANSAWPELILSILQNNLFVLPVGEDGRGIRYHHLFRDFLQARLESELPGEKASLLGRLVEVFAAREDWDRAYAACQRLDDPEALAGLVERAGSALVRGGRLRTAAEWVDALPAGLLAARPSLLSLRGVAAIIQGQVERGLSLLNQAEALQRAAPETLGLSLTLARRATAHRFAGDYAAALEDAHTAHALARRLGAPPALEAETLRAAGMAYYQMGRLNEAIERLSHALALYRAAGDAQNVALVLMELGLASMSAGHYRQALAEYEQAFAHWQATGNLIGQANLLNNRGVLHHLMGDYLEALASFEAALVCARQSGYARMEAYVLCGIGELYADLDAVEAPLDAYRRAREIARRIDYRFLLFYLDLAEAALYRRSGDLAEAEQRVPAGRVSEAGSEYEKALGEQELGRIRLAQGRPLEAAVLLASAASRFEAGGQQVEAARSGLNWAAALHQVGDLPAALAQLGKSLDQSARLDSVQVLVVAGRETRRLLLAAAQARAPNPLAARLLDRIAAFERGIPALRRQLRPRTATIPFGVPRLAIQSLGRGQVELDGKPVKALEWQNQKRVREFFYCLLSHPDGLTKEEIGLIFWPDSSPAQLKLQFKNLIYRLRCALGAEVILFDGDRYWFNRELDYFYDVEALFNCLASALAAETLADQITAYQSALDLYGGVYLPEMSGAWVWPERERIRQAHEQAVLTLGRLYLRMKDPERSIALCQQILAEDGCLEEAHRLLMEAYWSLGNQAALARQFERCCQVLMEEVNSPPSQRTRDLYESLRSPGPEA